MKKIISLFMRDYSGNRQVFDEIVPGAEWVVAGEGIATVKIDGTSCLVREGKLYKRYDHKPDNWKAIQRAIKSGKESPAPEFSPPPIGFEPAQDPDPVTHHYPGWLPVGMGPEDQWHREAYGGDDFEIGEWQPDGTYELVGPKVQGNPYHLWKHELKLHGGPKFSAEPPRTFEELRQWFEKNVCEGIVWHHPDGRMVKIKRKDFGLPWPVENSNA